MSGIEIAGLVLGAFPVLLYALESYRKSAEGLTEWWRIQRTVKKCRQDLQYHRILFEGNLERFLLPLVVDDDELQTLMADPAGEGWEDPELEVRLKQRLPKSYDLFIDIMEGIQELVESLKKELGASSLTRLVNADALSLANLEFQAKRIKFTVRKSARERLFTQMQEANERMRKLLENDDQISTARQRGQSAKALSPMYRRLNDFWRHAKRLHEALSTAWRCTCTSHIANLALEHRTSDKIEFDVFFQIDTSHQPSGRHATTIKMIPNGNTGTVSVVQQSAVSTNNKVRWATSLAQPPPASTDHTPMIKDLCTALGSSCPDCIGYLEADDFRFLIYTDVQNNSCISSTITLAQLLSNPSSLSRRKRYSIALTLASSYLQLSASPWLSMPLRTENVLFLQPTTEPQSALTERPYLQQELTQISGAPSADMISSLGVRLLELCFGNPIEATLYRKQLPAGDDHLAPIFDYTAAIQWSRLVSEEAGPEFAEAIDWCLQAKTLTDNNWRKDLWEHVIVPLEACHKQVSQKPMMI
jgi:hypothetical protein